MPVWSLACAVRGLTTTQSTASSSVQTLTKLMGPHRCQSDGLCLHQKDAVTTPTAAAFTNVSLRATITTHQHPRRNHQPLCPVPRTPNASSRLTAGMPSVLRSWSTDARSGALPHCSESAVPTHESNLHATTASNELWVKICSSRKYLILRCYIKIGFSWTYEFLNAWLQHFQSLSPCSESVPNHKDNVATTACHEDSLSWVEFGSRGKYIVISYTLQLRIKKMSIYNSQYNSLNSHIQLKKWALCQIFEIYYC